jgi:hypothetical protein
MALIISAYDLIVRVDALPMSVAEFGRGVPNHTFCTDDHIARVSFMVVNDREHFASRLAPVIDRAAIARVDRSSSSVDVPWLERGTHSGVEAVWLRGAPRDPLVVPVGWKPGELVFGTWDDMKQHLEYVGKEGDIDVYIDKRTGKKLYTGRTQRSPSGAQQAQIAELRSESAALLKPIFDKVFGRQDLGFFEKRKLRGAVEVLERILAIDSSDGAAHWTLGMIARSQAEHGKALDHFRQAYASIPRDLDVGREYAGQCFMSGEGEEGLRVSRALHEQFPDDVAIHSNLALAMLIAGDLDEALATAEAASARDPADPITRNLIEMIRKVKSGSAKRPTRI